MQPLYAPTHQGYVHLPYPQQQPMYVVMPVPDGQQHHQAYVPQQHNHQQPAYPTVSSNLLLHPMLPPPPPPPQAYHFATDGAYVMTPPGSEELQQFHGLPPATVRRTGGGPMPYYHVMSVPPPLSAAALREPDAVTTPMSPVGPLHVGPMMGTARSPPQYQPCVMHSMVPSTPLGGLCSVVAVPRQSALSTDNMGKLSPLMSNGTSAKKGRKQPQQPPPPPQQQGCPPGGNATDTIRDLNGLQFRLGRWYEGTVKRYNPLRGFGFLTGTDALWVHTPDCEAVCAVSALEQEEDGPHDNEDGETKNASDSKELANTDTTGIVEENEVASTTKQKTKETRHIIRQGGTTQLHGVVVPSTMQWYLQHQSQSGRLRRIPMPTLGDIFVHHSCISMNGFRVLPVGRTVRFSVAVLMGTVQAVDVVPLNASWWVPSSLTAMSPPAVGTAAGDTVERETSQSMPESSRTLLDSPPPSPALPTTAIAVEEVVTAVPLAAQPPSCAVPAAVRAVIQHRLRVAPPEKASGSMTEDHASDRPSAMREKSAVASSLENSPLSAVDGHFERPTGCKGYLDRLAVIPSAAVPNAVEARSELLIVRVRQLKSLDLVEAASTVGGSAASDSVCDDEGEFRGGWETPTGASLEKALQQLGVAHSDIYAVLKDREWGAKTTSTAGNASAMPVTSEVDRPPEKALHPTMIGPTGGEGTRSPRPIPQHRDILEVEEGNNTGPSARIHQTPLRSTPGEYLCSRLPFLQECSSVGDLVTAPRHTLPPTLAKQFSSDDPVGTLLRSPVSDGKSAHTNTSNLDCSPKRSTGGKTCSATCRDIRAGTPVYEARGSSPQRLGGNMSDVKQSPHSPPHSPPCPHTSLGCVGMMRKSVSCSYSGTPDRCQAASVPAAVSLSSPRGTETGEVPDPLSTGGTARGTRKPSSDLRLTTPNAYGGYHDTSFSSREAPSGYTTTFSPQLAESSLSTIPHIHEASTNDGTSPTSQAGNLYFSMQYVMSTPDENLSPIPMELLRLGGRSNSSLSHLQSSD